MNNFAGRLCATAALTVIALLQSLPGGAQNYPERPIRFIDSPLKARSSTR